MLLSSDSNAKSSTHQITNLFHFDYLNVNKLWQQDSCGRFTFLGLTQLAYSVEKENNKKINKALAGRVPPYFGAVIDPVMSESTSNKRVC